MLPGRDREEGERGLDVKLWEKPLLLTAWWNANDGRQLHVSDLIVNPEKRKLLPLLDQLALELEISHLDA
jgi:hypothetical protein